MDRAEAIKREDRVVYNLLNHEDKDAARLAFEAMREQEQREQGCEFCGVAEMDLYFNEGKIHQMDDHVYISGNRIECDFGCRAWGAFEIHFCPMCGRELKEGAE